jgi:hypothetical protein
MAKVLIVIFAIASMMLVTVPAAGADCVTVDGYFVAASETILDRAVRYSTHRDTEAIMKLVNAGVLVMVRGGTRVHIEKMGIGKARIRFPGATMSVWTVREALNCE